MGDALNRSEVLVCPICGKHFFVPIMGEWVYHKTPNAVSRTSKYFCSWTCMRKYEKLEEEEEIKRFGRKMRHTVKHG